MSKSRSKIIKNRILVTTISNACYQKVFDQCYDTVLIDEAGQAKEVECLVPVTNGCQRIIIIGDDKQLSPLIFSKSLEGLNFNKSILQKFLETNMSYVVLTDQFRMHPAICEFPNEFFYNGQLKNGVTALDRTDKRTEEIFGNTTSPMIFQDCRSGESIHESGVSYRNLGQIKHVQKYVEQLIQADVDQSEIGIISPYEGQKLSMVNALEKIYPEVEISNIDSFQGREKNYIIISTVRSNKFCEIGFLDDGKRMNVALTRAKFGLIIIGNFSKWH